MYIFGLVLLDKGKHIFKHSITISYVMPFILSIFLSLKSLHKCCLFFLNIYLLFFAQNFLLLYYSLSRFSKSSLFS